jgi:hypothetical protein
MVNMGFLLTLLKHYECQNHLSNLAGDFRNGKSFLLNFMIRYLEAGGQRGWMEREEEFWIPRQNAAGFSYRLKLNLKYWKETKILNIHPLVLTLDCTLFEPYVYC